MSDDQSVAIAAMAGIGELLSCIGPTCGDTVDWSAAEKVYGTPFPADYRAFVAAFGRGSIEEIVGIHIPAVNSNEQGIAVSRLSEAALADEWVCTVFGSYKIFVTGDRFNSPMVSLGWR
ncbi:MULTISPECIES: SMI1/KNR4 family protein [Kitasatospora]|uniref:SMI1/KNR4 family protein n=1 Tax=Kitasatospora cathayae TaxID=3004092 RepID=A0ABY7QEZ7_9ACTN|nr:hypothetical protein [Kitasatospora sp. HUAS 3-15]WBP91335.1 hypothetical protein O1G21_39280 [Kitasatospora sp. HUAS 3-15]